MELHPRTASRMVTKGDILAGAPTFQRMAHNAHPMLLLWCFSMPHERKISYIYIASLLCVLIVKFKMCVFNSFVLLYVSLILYVHTVSYDTHNIRHVSECIISLSDPLSSVRSWMCEAHKILTIQRWRPFWEFYNSIFRTCGFRKDN